MEPPRMHYVWGELGPFEDLHGKPHLTSAGVAWENPGDGFTAWVPDSDPLMVDSGGFQAATKWPDCQYPYSPTELFDWAEEIGADIVAGMDVACETRSILQELDTCQIDPGPIEERLAKSLEYQIEQDRIYREGRAEGRWSFDFMPVVQGYTLDQYRWFARQLRRHDVWTPEADRLTGIGSVCKRDDVDRIREVAQTVRAELPDGRFHLFGATIHVWKDRRLWGLFESSDTAAWKYMAWSKAHKCELLAQYMEKVEQVQSRMQGQDSIMSFTGPSLSTIYAARWGDVAAIRQLSEMGWYSHQ